MFIPVIVSILIAEFAGAVGSLFTTPGIATWYATLVRPSFAPPNWVFGPVWTTLFALMGIAAALVWHRRHRDHRAHVALNAYGVQLLLNVGWSGLFFGLHRPDLALVEIGVLWIAIAITALLFFRVDRRAGWLMIPYLVWVSFAAFLNAAFVSLNR